MKLFGVEICNWDYSSIKPKQEIKENNIDKSFPPMYSGTPMPPCKPPKKEDINRDLPHLKAEILSEGYDPAKPNPT